MRPNCLPTSLSKRYHNFYRRWRTQAGAQRTDVLAWMGFFVLSLGGAVEWARSANILDFQEFNYDLQNNGSIDLPGRLFIPPESITNPNASYPLVIFMHGLGERGTNNTSQINSYLDNLITRAKSEKFFLYAPQIPTNTLWYNASVDNVWRMIGNALQQYPVDRTRIYVTGLSAGGGGTWNSLSRYSDVVAAGVPLSAASNTGGSAASLNTNMVGKAIWAYHARNDTNVAGAEVTRTRAQVSSIRGADGLPAITSAQWPLNNSTSNPYYNNGAPYYTDGSTFYDVNGLRYSEYATGGHTGTTWGRAYNEAPMYTWLLAKSSGNTELQVQESVNFDLGATVADTAPDSASHWWNSTMYGHHNTVGVVVPFARISTGRRTSVSLAVTAPFGTAIATGLTTGTPFDLNIGSDGWITLLNATATSNAGAVTIEGLIPGAKYRLEIFASNSDNDGNRGRSARYEVSGATRDLEAYNNATNTAVFASVTADQYGEVTVKTYATPGTTSRYGQINTLQITAIVNADIVLSQNFQTSTNVTDFVSASTPSNAQFNDIGTSSAGGTWTVNGSGQLQIVRVGGASGVNGAGLSRWTDFAGSPAVLKMSLDLGTTINSFQNDLLSIEIGHFNGAIGYNNAPAATDLFARINVDGSTPNNIKFEIGGVQSAAFPANGTMHSLTIFLNKSGVARAYTAPDGSTPTLDANRLSVWVGTACLFPNVAASNGSSSALTDFRIRLGTPDTGTWKFDNFHAENNF